MGADLRGAEGVRGPCVRGQLLALASVRLLSVCCSSGSWTCGLDAHLPGVALYPQAPSSVQTSPSRGRCRGDRFPGSAWLCLRALGPAHFCAALVPRSPVPASRSSQRHHFRLGPGLGGAVGPTLIRSTSCQVKERAARSPCPELGGAGPEPPCPVPSPPSAQRGSSCLRVPQEEWRGPPCRHLRLRCFWREPCGRWWGARALWAHPWPRRGLGPGP